MRALLIMAVTVIVAAGCWTPASNPISSDYPCGPRGRVCVDRQCCWENDDCGGETPGCPADSCCYAGDPFDTLESRRTGVHTKKWKQGATQPGETP